MKKLLPVIGFFALCSSVTLSAQTEFGISAGFYESHRNTNIFFENDGIGNKNYNGGYYIGTFIGIRLSDRFYLQPEVNYIRINRDFDQLHVPLLGRYRIGKKFNVFLGPNFGFLLTNNENFRPFSLALALGVSYDITDRLTIEIRYNFALSESLRTDFGTTTIPTAKFSGVLIGLKYRFDW